ncbi:hypothetical protein [Pseudomonas haemolytica]|uniref:Uncharacterized protein n=1 Tax=Pseudomonas haemolytica TaxID=2600065 RepID=A0A5P1D8P4_9PSED|nr:hypothetical protein [Pseudomonas haemolytica]MBJ2244054.1 hypothetical protein [Pseudomonas haemolytica]MBJ2272035.1 hypothetical protein [Pseudomonas haemolytica]MBK3448193.1 hypothetical protein [Pseudomonas haemolytica]MBK3458987.1 hypothetical protein [Pseudomonas haemolytica]MRJ36039.1 hypothetical protein [Pseudomonas haemolytica]
MSTIPSQNSYSHSLYNANEKSIDPDKKHSNSPHTLHRKEDNFLPANTAKKTATAKDQVVTSLIGQRLNTLTDKPVNSAATAPAQQPMESRPITEVPRALTSTPTTHTYDNGTVKITSATAHEGSFHGIPMLRNKVTIETGNSADNVHLKSLPDIGVVAEINGRRYLLPVQNVGGMTDTVEIKTKGGDDHVKIADDIWFQTTVSLNDNHTVSGTNGYTSAPESAGVKTFSQPEIIAIAPHLQKGAEFKHDETTFKFSPNNNPRQFGDGVMQIIAGSGNDTIRISAAEDNSLLAEVNGQKFLLPIKNDPSGGSRLFIQAGDGEDKVTIDSNVKNYAFINMGDGKAGTLYSGGGFVSGEEEPNLKQRYTTQNYNPVETSA